MRGKSSLHDARPVRAVVVGAGSAGLACAALLRRDGLDVEVFDRAATVGDAWLHRYDGLRLNTIRSLSAMPGLSVLRSWGRWVPGHRYQVYLDRYARHHRLPLRLGVTVHSVLPAADGWLVQTSAGSRHADVAVVAIGNEGRPSWPRWPGRSGYTGRLLHSTAYRSPEPFAGRDVLVVGAGSSGTEIALALAGVASRVRLAVRTPPVLIPVEVAGFPIQVAGVLLGWLPWRVLDGITLGLHRLYYRDLAAHGLPVPPEGAYARFRRSGDTPVFERGFAAAIRARGVEIVPAVRDLDRDSAILADGTRVRPDAVIAATGFEPAFADLVRVPGALDAADRPVAWAGRLPGADGLFIVGAPSMRGNLYQHAADARRVRREVRRLLAAARPDVRTSAAG